MNLHPTQLASADLSGKPLACAIIKVDASTFSPESVASHKKTTTASFRLSDRELSPDANLLVFVAGFGACCLVSYSIGEILLGDYGKPLILLPFFLFIAYVLVMDMVPSNAFGNALAVGLLNLSGLGFLQLSGLLFGPPRKSWRLVPLREVDRSLPGPLLNIANEIERSCLRSECPVHLYVDELVDGKGRVGDRFLVAKAGQEEYWLVSNHCRSQVV